MTRRPWKPREPDVTRKPPKGRLLFKPGDRVKFIRSPFAGQEVIVVGRKPGHDDIFKVTRNLANPHSQRDWVEVRADDLGFDSAIDQLGSLVLDEHGKLDESL